MTEPSDSGQTHSCYFRQDKVGSYLAYVEKKSADPKRERKKKIMGIAARSAVIEIMISNVPAKK